MDFVITISGCSLGRQSLIGYLREKLRENLIERTARRRAISSFRIDSRAALFLGCPLALLPGVLEFGPGAGVVRPRCGSGGAKYGSNLRKRNFKARQNRELPSRSRKKLL